MNQPLTELPVVVIGAGPVGLAAAAHLADRNIDFLLLESGDEVAAAIRQWGHVRLFSPWRYNIDATAQVLLEKTAWTAPDLDANPTGADLVEEYLAPLAATPQIAPRLRLGHKVTAISHARDRRGLLGCQHSVVAGGAGAAGTGYSRHLGHPHRLGGSQLRRRRG